MDKTEPTLLYKHNLSNIPDIQPKIHCSVEILEPSDLQKLESIRSLPAFKIRQFENRFQKGNLCFIAIVEGVPAHYTWLQTTGKHRIQPAAKTKQVKSGEAWIFDCRTVDWARGNRIYPYVLTTILKSLQSENYSCVWIYTSTANIASQRGICKAGFQLKQRLYCLEIGNYILRLPPLPQ